MVSQFFAKMGVHRGYHEEANHDAYKNHIIHNVETHEAPFTCDKMTSPSPKR
jgi:hypothetical protein